MRNRLIEAFGWYGTGALLLAYVLASFSVIPADGLWFQGLCATGSAGIIAVSVHRKTYQPAVLNIVLLLIGLAAIARIIARP